MLSSHPQIIPTRRKELCLGGILSETWSKFFHYLPNMTSSQNKIVMSGCLHLGSNIKAMYELCVQEIKMIYVIRDVADMLWSAYNFWCIPNHDENCYPGKHTSKGSIRNPQHFHEMILQYQNMGGGISLTRAGTCYQKELEEALKHIGTRNVLVVKSESMLSEEKKRFAIQEIQTFLFPDTAGHGVMNEETHNWIAKQSQSLYRVNSGRSVDSRGERNIENSSIQTVDQDEGLYEISNYQPMLLETRRIIYERWSKECQWLKEKYNIHYVTAC